MLPDPDNLHPSKAPIAFQPSNKRLISENGPIFIASCAADIEQIGQLRYALFVERDGKQFPHANHDARTLIEPVDETSFVFGARLRNTIECSVRLTWLKKGINDPLIDNIATVIAELGLEIDTTVVNSRLVVRPDNRAKFLIPSMFRAVYSCGFLGGAEHGVVAAKQSLVPMFEKFGFRKTERAIFDSYSGSLEILVLKLRDRDHLAHVRSPLLLTFDQLTKGLK